MNSQKKAYLFASIAVLSWSTVATAFKLALEEYDYFQLLFISSGTAVILLYTSLLIKKRNPFEEIKKKQLWIFIVGGFLNPFLYYLVLFKAYSILPAQMAQSLNYTWPIVLVLFSSLYFKQKLRFQTVLSFLIGFIGVSIISFQGHLYFPVDTSILGIVLAVGSSLIWASFWVLNSSQKADVNLSLFFNFLVGFILIIPVMMYFSSFPEVHLSSLAAAIYTGLFEMGIAFLFWHLALRLSTTAAKISNLVYISPFISLFIISLILHEEILPSTIAGLIIIIGAILIDKLQLKRKT
jgi:drug/metabolite transporter (DMT)-like permease